MWGLEEAFIVGHGLIFRFFLASLLLVGVFVEAGKPSTQVKSAVAPYLMPASHPIKPLLDTLFVSSRVILNLDTLREAGFTKAKPRKFTKLIVTTHPAFPGYIFKLYLDAQRFHKNLPEHHYWVLRVKGAQKVQDEITKRGLGGQFKVPQKWIYEIPQIHMSSSGYYTKTYILVEEDMNLMTSHDNEKTWASSYVTTTLLDDLYSILENVGLYDCAKTHNIPFSQDGRIAFIDTQTWGSRHVAYQFLTPYLSKPNQAYWKSLTR